jgi:hypothetical protein
MHLVDGGDVSSVIDFRLVERCEQGVEPGRRSFEGNGAGHDVTNPGA